MQTEEINELSSNRYSVARVNLELENRSSLGSLLVSRDGDGKDNFNRTYAVDGRWGIGDDNTLSGFLAKTESPDFDSDDYEHMRDSMSKLALNDSSFSYEPEVSPALAYRFRCGFLGLLHLEIIRDRFEREFNLELVTTAPSVVYKILMKDGSTINLHNPTDMPDPVKVENISEPWIKATIIVPEEFLG